MRPDPLPKAPLLLALSALFCPLSLLGCGSTPTHSVPATSNANWQIQAGSSITYPPTGGYLLGAIQTEGSQVTGSFTNNNLACSPPFSTYIGSAGSSNELTLKAPFDSATLLNPTAPYTLTTGTLSGGGYLCNASTSGPAVGIEIPPLNGTYAGTLVNLATGTATLTVTQSSTPNALGQFLVTGTLQFSSSGCSSTGDLTGTISGSVISLNGQAFTLSAYDSHAGSLLDATLTLTTSGCSTTPYTGPLTLQ